MKSTSAVPRPGVGVDFHGVNTPTYSNTTAKTTTAEREVNNEVNRAKVNRPHAHEVNRSTLPPLSEKDFQRQVMDLAGIFGWTVYHPMLSKWSERGFPDLTMVRPPRVLFAELKRENGKVSHYQDEWLVLLGACPGVEVHLWRPSDLERIAEILR